MGYVCCLSTSSSAAVAQLDLFAFSRGDSRLVGGALEYREAGELLSARGAPSDGDWSHYDRALRWKAPGFAGDAG